MPEAGVDAAADAHSFVDSGTPVVVINTEGGGGIQATDGPSPNCTAMCPDFPAAPLFDDKAKTLPPENAATLFGSPDNMASTGPCVLEPQLAMGSQQGALFPANWLRPRFRFEPLAGENLWEIRLHATIEANDYVVYTTATSWAMPKAVWTALAQNVHNAPITVTIRGLNTAAPGQPSGTSGSFQIAPVYAGGSMVYWASTSQEINPGTSKLVGFRVGDESVINALTIPQVGNRGVIGVTGAALRSVPDMNASKTPGDVQCIGCHEATPDGDSVAFTDLWPWVNIVASVKPDDVGKQPAYVSAGGARLISQPWLGAQTFSAALWEPGKRIAVASYGKRNVGGSGVGFPMDSAYAGQDTLAWFNLETTAEVPFTAGQTAQLNAAIAAAEGTGWGRLTLKGETAAALTPNFSHDGTRIAYTSCDAPKDGRIGQGNTDVNIHVVPYNDGKGGDVVPLSGASEKGVAEYYPNFSFNDALVAFNRVSPIDAKAIYYRPEGEIWVTPSAGGVATRLAANDPPQCSKQTSPGIINSWPKWSPNVVKAGGKNYYFLIFSSGRKYPGQFETPVVPNTQPPLDRHSSQLYMASIVEDVATHQLTTYAGIYLWNQDPTTTNLTPAWNEFKIPVIPDPPR